MEAEQVFKLAAAAVALAEVLEEALERGVMNYFDLYPDVEEAFKEYQHARDRG